MSSPLVCNTITPVSFPACIDFLVSLIDRLFQRLNQLIRERLPPGLIIGGSSASVTPDLRTLSRQHALPGWLLVELLLPEANSSRDFSGNFIIASSTTEKLVDSNISILNNSPSEHIKYSTDTQMASTSGDPETIPDISHKITSTVPELSVSHIRMPLDDNTSKPDETSGLSEGIMESPAKTSHHEPSIEPTELIEEVGSDSQTKQAGKLSDSEDAEKPRSKHEGNKEKRHKFEKKDRKDKKEKLNEKYKTQKNVKSKEESKELDTSYLKSMSTIGGRLFIFLFLREFISGDPAVVVRQLIRLLYQTDEPLTGAHIAPISNLGTSTNVPRQLVARAVPTPSRETSVYVGQLILPWLCTVSFFFFPISTSTL
ncbi:unnamed protein product [Protopolystoma xenopodis]|uniref:Uncharacterized protein n=1 Tax=Protopolystoma xenopodis TaxID=117903 RepID=A0A3S5C6H5_9PLAT|nr:unnamed protein product [Protopolystoma xenopodis]